MAETTRTKATTEKFLDKAKRRFKLVEEAESELRKLSLDDLKFSVGDQWPENIKSLRGDRPSLTMDQIGQSIKQVTNEYRQQRPATQINPVGDDSDVDTAEILQGVVRHIEVRSDAEIAYDNAHEFTVRIGFGSWRILSEVVDDEGNQEVVIRKIRNPFSVYWMPGVEHEDAGWGFIVTDEPVDDYDEKYYDEDNTEGRYNAESLVEFCTTGDQQPGWITERYIRVAEYFEVEETKEKGKKTKKQVKWYKINALEILDERDLPGSSIPILTVVGDDVDVDGKRHLAGLVRLAKQPQMMFNLMCSAAVEQIALSSKAPWIMAEGQDEGHEDEWAKANNINYSSLKYKPISLGGTPLPPPQRNAVEPPIQALKSMVAQFDFNLKAAIGLYNPSLGQQEGDQSGKAIEKLQKQGDVATLNFSDNTAREMRRNGRLLIEWIRDKYDVPRVQRIIKPDGSVSQVVIHNGPGQKDDAKKLAETDPEKVKKIFDIGVGEYDVTVDVGPSFQTKRQESVASQLEFLKLLPPQVAMNFTDLVTANMDWPQAKEYSARAKKMLPPQLQDDDASDPAVKLQQTEATLQQAMQQHQLLVKALGDATDVIKTKKIEQEGKTQIAQMQEMTKQAVVKMQEATKLAVAQINASKDLHQSFAENEIAQYKLLHDPAHELGLQKDQQAHEQAMGAQQAAQDQQSQAADQQHEAGQQASDQAHEVGMTAVNQDHEQQMAEQQQEAEPANA